MTLNDSPFSKDGETVWLARQGKVLYQKVQNPFAISIVCSPKTDGAFWCDWWITGSPDPSPGHTPPVLLIQMSMAILGKDRNELFALINQFWEERIEELAFASAVAGGTIVDSGRLKAQSDFVQKRIISHHLSSHDALDHFSPPDKKARRNLTLRTAFMYELLRSLGVSKVQRTIAEFESLNYEAFYEEAKEGQEIALSAATVNQRLAQARKAGLLTVGDSKKGRTPNASKDLKYYMSDDWVYESPKGSQSLGYARDKSGANENKKHE